MPKDNGDGPMLVNADTPAVNGHRQYPAGNAEFFGVDSERQGSGQAEYRDFMTAHTGDMARLIGEANLDDDQIEQLLNLMAIDQRKFGYVSMVSIMKAKLACTIGKAGRGRDDAVKVATAPTQIMRRMRGMMGRMFGMGGQSPMGGGGTPPPNDMGY